MKMNGWNIARIKNKYALTTFSFFLSVFLFVSFTIDSAHANAQQCRALRSQLANLSVLEVSSKSVSKEFEKFDLLSKRQSSALKSARRDAVALKCVSRSGKRTGQGAASCPSLLTKIGKMEKNLQRINAKLQNAQPQKTKTPADVRREKRAIRAKIQNLRCGSNQRIATNNTSNEQETRTTRPGLLARLFGTQDRKRHQDERKWRQERIVRLEEKADEKVVNRSLGNVVRTLCVRVCDGYFFPVSFATTRQSFDADRAFCEASNPSTEMRLFFHQNPTEDIEDMKDLTGRLYTDLPNAFRHRREVVDNQTCPRVPQQSAFKQVAGLALGEALSQTQSQFGNAYGDYENEPAKPAPKPNAFIDIDSHMAQVGQFELKSISQIEKDKFIAGTVVTTYDPSKISDLGIRVVGPTFLYDQQSVELLLAPDQIQVQ